MYTIRDLIINLFNQGIYQEEESDKICDGHWLTVQSTKDLKFDFKQDIMAVENHTKISDKITEFLGIFDTIKSLLCYFDFNSNLSQNHMKIPQIVIYHGRDHF